MLHRIFDSYLLSNAVNGLRHKRGQSMRVKEDRKKYRTMTKESRTVVVGLVRQGRGEILVRLHCSVYQTLDDDLSVTLPLMAVAAIWRRLNMNVRYDPVLKLMMLGHPQTTFSNPGILGRMPGATFFDRRGSGEPGFCFRFV